MGLLCLRLLFLLRFGFDLGIPVCRRGRVFLPAAAILGDGVEPPAALRALLGWTVSSPSISVEIWVGSWDARLPPVSCLSSCCL